MIGKPKIVSTEAEEIIKKAAFIFMMNSKTLISKTSANPKRLQVKICLQSSRKEWFPEEFSPIFTKLAEWVDLLFGRDKIVKPEELMIQVVDALRFGQSGLTKMLAFFGKTFSVGPGCEKT